MLIQIMEITMNASFHVIRSIEQRNNRNSIIMFEFNEQVTNEWCLIISSNFDLRRYQFLFFFNFCHL